MPEKHSFIGPSAAEIWFHCPPSMRTFKKEKQEEEDNPTADYKAEGTCAHAVGEYFAKKIFLHKGGEYKEEIEKIRAEYPEVFSKEMLDYADDYTAYLQNIYSGYDRPRHMMVEQFLPIFGNTFGTTDCAVVGIKAGVGVSLDVVDFKYGKGVKVDAKNNLQMLLYGYGVYRRYRRLFNLQDETPLTLHIFQPRLKNISQWDIKVGDMLKKIDELRKQAELAEAGLGDFSPGHWCRFCPGADSCKHRANKIKASLTENLSEDKNKLQNEDYAKLLDFFKEMNVESWIKQIKAHSLNCILSGEDVPGWKAVEGRSKTTITDFKTLEKFIVDNKMGESKDLYSPGGITLIKKAIGAKNFKKVPDNCFTKTPGRPTLAEASDPRKDYTSSDFAKNEFTKI